MTRSDSPRLVLYQGILFALLLFVFLNGLLWSLVIPFDGAPDEIHKYEIVYFIWRNYRLPVLGPSADVYIRPAPGTRDGYVYGAAALYPSGAYLLAALFMGLSPLDTPLVLLHAARLSSVCCTVVTIYLIYRITYALFRSRGYALGVAAFTALIPQFTYTGAYVGDDAYQIMAVTLTIWATVGGAQENWTLRNRILLGLGLALVSAGKQNGWFVAIPFALLGLFSTWGGSWRQRVKTWACIVLPPGLTLGSWLGRNELFYDDPWGFRASAMAWQDYVSRIGFEWEPLVQQGYGFLDLVWETPWLQWMFESFWGRFFYFTVPMDGRIYSALFIGSILGALVTMWVLLRRRDQLFPSKNATVVVGCGVLSIGLLFATAAMTSLYNDFQPQGRYFFPAILPIVVLLTVGLHTLGRLYLRRYIASLWVAVILLMLVLNVFCLITYVHGHPYPEIPLPGY